MAKNDGAPAATKKSDDFEAARQVRDILKGFTPDERQRILRWAGESLGIDTSPLPAPPPNFQLPPTAVAGSPIAPPSSPSAKAKRDIATFVNEKNPQTDIQLATTIAYYYRFEAPEDQRVEEIDAKLLQEALRQAGRPGKLVKPLATLNNAHGKGLLDRGSARGKFVINSVGENLVGMALPGEGTQPARPRQRVAREKGAGRRKAVKRSK